MSVIGEVVGIVGCVAGVVSAYHDGGAIIRRIKAKRARIRAPPPPVLLEESIDQAPEEIEKEKNRGVARFGKAFEEGDHIAVIALQQVTIQLQSSLLGRLRNAAFDDEVTDFTYLVDASDLGRDRTIGALLELRQRLLQAAPISELSVSTPQGPQTLVPSYQQVSVPYEKPVSTPLPGLSTVQSPTKQHQTLTRDNGLKGSAEENATSATPGTVSDQDRTNRTRHNALLGFFRQQRTNSGSHKESTSRDLSLTASALLFRTPKQDVVRESAVFRQSKEPEEPKFTYQEGEDNPFEIWGSKTNQDKRRNTVLALPDPGLSKTSSLSATNPRTLASAPYAIQRTVSSPAALNPNPENNYLGFCKGAVDLQNGNRAAMRKRKEFNDGWSQSTVYYLACSNSICAFGGHIDIDVIWSKVWRFEESRGLKFRWSFLAKSHVCQPKVQNRQFKYKCLFCVFLRLKSDVIEGTTPYLVHVSQEHRGQALGEVVLYKTGCVNDRVCEDVEDFDINLFPLSAEERLALQRQNAIHSLDTLEGTAKRNSEAQDSMFPSGRWNEDRPDFHLNIDLDPSAHGWES